MLTGERIILRARRESDVDVLHADLYDDVDGRSRSDNRAWRPTPAGELSPLAPRAPSDPVAEFTVASRDDADVLGLALLWWIDTHNRAAHIGISLRPIARGKGYGTEAVALLCRYGFSVLGLNRIQIETLADNGAMLGAARACGFVVEGTTRQSAWVLGQFMDDVVLGLLASEWAARDAQGPSA